ncbi:hypothetical protein C1645_42480 [Glomus cerebriforme]|uniref:Uncharacterized protein n=1 Tax=Glomus cerebriforme TaxID=658196 RepID=A0A397SAN7_9GLOM|nr:hypothetical protein C1645_42480 [Glomus cerebriforme]
MSSSYEVTDTRFGTITTYQASAIQDGNAHLYCAETSAGVKYGPFGPSAEAKYGASVYRYNDGVGDLKLLSSGVGMKVGADPYDGIKAKFEARADLVDVEAGGVRSRIGINADTGASIGGGNLEAKVAGVGFKVGKEIGVSTPLGDVSIDLEKVFTNLFG